MYRIYFKRGEQKKILEDLKRESGMTWIELAKIAGLCDRTLRDWHRERFRASYEIILFLLKKFNDRIYKNLRIVPEYWHVKEAGRKGAIKRNAMYGNPGTPEGRRKGGLITINKFKKDPIYAKRRGFKLEKAIIYPKRSDKLAELIGIILGDGSISNYQIIISLNSKKDIEYSKYIVSLIYKLFKIKASVRYDIKNSLQVIISSINLIRHLLKRGLKRGNKKEKQVDVPKWVLRKKDLMKSCLRGLIDTDGGFYTHTHVTKGIKYINCGLCFTNLSVPLLNSVHNMFKKLGINSKRSRNHVSVYGFEGIKKYMNIVGSHNQRNKIKFNTILKIIK